MSNRTRLIPASKIQPCSVIGDSIEIKSRDIQFPFQRIRLVDNKGDCEKIDYIYTCYGVDNSSAVILKETSYDCLKNEYTLDKLNDKISGTKIHIQTIKRIASNKMNVKNQSARHKTQKIVAKDFTCVELLKEESNIIKSSDYQDLLNKKLEMNNSYGDIELIS